MSSTRTRLSLRRRCFDMVSTCFAISRGRVTLRRTCFAAARFAVAILSSIYTIVVQFEDKDVALQRTADPSTRTEVLARDDSTVREVLDYPARKWRAARKLLILRWRLTTVSSILGIHENIFEKSCNAFWPNCVSLCGPLVVAVSAAKATADPSTRTESSLGMTAMAVQSLRTEG